MDEKRNDLYFNEIINILSDALNDQNYMSGGFSNNFKYCKDILRTYNALYSQNDIDHFRNYVNEYLNKYKNWQEDRLKGIQEFIIMKGHDLTDRNKELLKKHAIRGDISKLSFLRNVSLDYVNEIESYADRYCERCQYETPITLDIDIRDTVCKASEDEENNIANYHDYYRHHCYISKKDEFNNMTWYELVRGEKRPMNDKDIIDIVDNHGIFQKRLYFMMNEDGEIKCHTILDNNKFEKIDFCQIGYPLPLYLIDDMHNQFDLTLLTRSFIFYVNENGDELKMYRTEDFGLVSDNYFAEVGYVEEIIELFLEGKEYNLIYMDDNTKYNYKYLLLDNKGEMNDETDLYLDLLYNDDLLSVDKIKIENELKKLFLESNELENIKFDDNSSVGLYQMNNKSDYRNEIQSMYAVITKDNTITKLDYVGFNHSLAYECFQEIINGNIIENSQIINAKNVLAMTSDYGSNKYCTNMDAIIDNFYDIVGTNKIYIMKAENLRYGQDKKPEYFAHQDGDKYFIQDLVNHVNGTIMKNENGDLILYTRDADFSDDYLDGKYHMTLQKITVRLSPNQNTYEVIEADPETLFNECQQEHHLGNKINDIIQEDISLDDEEIDL
ncbi:hypothetical protein [[Clostridium] innocuum]|uniref:hypothetical protein n=1 Tax=Clostridium innocuum TaxID=1522 RepID=UPI001AF5E142|nr:hypothetical protein [[Clostridium] innocuum]MDU1018775.1 hypothetical protein [Bifidobacterium breve]QSI26872.1 hypothetical protein GKZ87_15960 [Erysipelotrichaceae bacterium 66202529]MCC2831838.1 hypothetical protein [[Clostridium] innocuum]MCR0248554.1 hypothetical protein [[Clostridium] innocuum]MCR0261065.1 hypothetical protein [[Clostridium] innocuum]